MRGPPKLAEATIVAALRDHYGLAATDLAFLALGNDSATSVYRVRAAGGADYFLKIRAAARFSLPSLAIPHYLHTHGAPHIVSPIPTTGGALWVAAEGFALTLYPFIEGRVGGNVGMTDQHWRELGALMRRVHATQLPPELLAIVPRETFTPVRRELISALEAAIDRPDHADPPEREVAAFWRERRAEIDALVARCDALAERRRRAMAPRALCHADMHAWNVLLDEGGRMWLVDWDETILALPERDLMFVIEGLGAGVVSARATERFFEGYSHAAIDPVALAYYRYAWAVQDICANGEEVFFLPDLGETDRQAAARGFKLLFEPGHIVALARDLDAV